MTTLKYILPVIVAAAFLAEVGAVDGIPKVNITADFQDGKINCDNLICPNATNTCLYSEMNSQYNQTIVIVTKQCLDESGQSLAMENSTFVDPTGDTYNIIISSGKGISVGKNGFDVEDISSEMKDMEDEAKKDLQNALDGIKNEWDNIRRWLKM